MERIVNEEPVGRGAVRERPGRAPVHRETVVPIAHAVDDLAPPAEFVVSPAAVTRTLGALVLALVGAHVVGQLSRLYAGRDSLFGLVQLFDLNLERNVPTWYATVSLLLCAVLLAVVARLARRAHRPYVAHWTALAIGFLLLSVEEMLDYHSALKAVSVPGEQARGFLLHAWVVPAAVIALVVAAVYLRFLMHLPARSRRLFVLAGLLYVGGAVGLESVSGQAQELFGRGSAPLALASTLEETAEMAGVLVFVYALLDYLHRAAPVLRLRLASSSRPVAVR